MIKIVTIIKDNKNKKQNSKKSETVLLLQFQYSAGEILNMTDSEGKFERLPWSGHCPATTTQHLSFLHKR